MLMHISDTKQDVRPTNIRIVCACWVHGQPRAIGDKIVVGRQDAYDLSAMKRAVITDKLPE